MHQIALFAQKKKPARGASIRGKKSSAPTMNRSVVYRIMWLGVLTFVGIAFYQMMHVLLSKPVARVAVTGEFRHVNRRAIAAQVQPFLAQGFVRLNLQAIRETLKTRPWIYDVTITRQWPDQISINVVEQKPIARWGSQGYLNHRAELFIPERLAAMNTLPLLEGPAGSAEQVMTNFQQLGKALQQQGLVLQALSLDRRGNWTATLDSSVSIVLGNTQVMEKMRRFVNTYQTVLSAQFERVQRIDMRYSNGLAVAWKHTETQREQHQG